jgi:hypothetical protein
MLDDRMALLAVLKCVALVAWFDEDTLHARILDCRPDVLVKGGNWPVENRRLPRSGWGAAACMPSRSSIKILLLRCWKNSPAIKSRRWPYGAKRRRETARRPVQVRP